MTCPKEQEVLALGVIPLDAERVRALEAHAAICAQCGEALALLSSSRRALAAFPVEASDADLERIAKGFAAQRPRPSMMMGWAPIAALAAVVSILVIVAAREQRSTPAGAPAVARAVERESELGEGRRVAADPSLELSLSVPEMIEQTAIGIDETPLSEVSGARRALGELGDRADPRPAQKREALDARDARHAHDAPGSHAARDVDDAPGSRDARDVDDAPGSRAAPDVNDAPGSRAARDVHDAPGSRPAPDALDAPRSPDAPKTLDARGAPPALDGPEGIAGRAERESIDWDAQLDSARGNAGRLEQLAGSNPPPSFEVQILLALADVARRAGETDRAITYFSRVADHPSGGRFAEEATLRAAQLQALIGERQAARATLTRARMRFGRGPLIFEREALAARLEREANEPRAAAELLLRVPAEPWSLAIANEKLAVAANLVDEDRELARELLRPLCAANAAETARARAQDLLRGRGGCAK